MERSAALNQLGERVRAAVANLQAMLQPHRELFPDTVAAVTELAEAVGIEFVKGRPQGRGLRRGKKTTLTLANAPWRVKALRGQLRYSRALRDRLQQRVRDLTCGKLRQNNALTPHWLVRVCLSMPVGRARAFHQAHVDLVGRGKKGCSRDTIGRIRSAFVAVATEQNMSAMKQVVSKHLASFVHQHLRVVRAGENEPVFRSRRGVLTLAYGTLQR